MQIVISDPKTRKAYAKKVEGNMYLNNKIGDEIDLSEAGLAGYKAKITGGSDKEGFPMKSSVPGAVRKKVFLSEGTGLRTTHKEGERRRISVRGNTVSDMIAQLNVKITAYGSANLDDMFPKGDKKEEKVSIKEQMVKKSLDEVGNASMAAEAKEIKKNK